MSGRYLPAVVLLLYWLVALVPLADSQELHFLRGVEQPAGEPIFEENDMAREFFFQNDRKVNQNLLELNVPPDTLVDPNGNLVADARIKIHHRRKQRLDEEQILEEELAGCKEQAIAFETWLFTLLGCACIVACGVMPAVLIRQNGDFYLQSYSGRKTLSLLLSFATGSLLGDVFLHLLPEVWSQQEVSAVTVGLWTLGGILACFFIEKCCSTTVETKHRVCAIMNLCANLADNFTHGLAVGGSFLVNPKLGFLTTFAIVIHELPHEISDFAILLRGHFTIWSAVKAQLFTAVGGILGACVAVYTHSAFAAGVATTRILAFTAGSFINIGLCQILPDLLQEPDSRQNTLQLILLFGGTLTMNFLNYFR